MYARTGFATGHTPMGARASLFNRSGIEFEEIVGLQSFGNILVLHPQKSF